MLYEGRVNCFSPKTHMDRQDLTIIRPMIYIDEYMTKKANEITRLNVLFYIQFLY